MDGTCAWLLRLKTRPSRGGFMENITMRNVRARFITADALEITNSYSSNGVASGEGVPPTHIDGVRMENVTVEKAETAVDLDPSITVRNLVLTNVVVNGRRADLSR